MNYLVVLEAGWIVENVEDIDDAISIAISEAGDMLNPDKDYVEVSLGYMNCPACSEAFESACIFGGTALVGLVFEINIYNADNKDHARKIARKEVGERLEGVRLDISEVIEKEEE